MTQERELNERTHADPDSEQQPELTYSHDDTRPNAAWNYANHPGARSRGWGVFSGGQWLKSLDDFGPHFTSANTEAQCFNTDEGAKRLGRLVVRHYIKQGQDIPVYVHRIPKGSY